MLQRLTHLLAPIWLLIVVAAATTAGHAAGLENRLREIFAFEGTPIRWITKES